jgi:acyl-[acyl-carrier-protein]-phospholipid O-acyltransferase/long-chain-fatty-acid--[acyl-carrier-protein] ligase
MRTDIKADSLHRHFSSPGQTLLSALRQSVARPRDGQVVAGFDDATGFVSRKELIKRALGAARIASQLSRPGQTIGLLLPNVAGAVAALLGIGAAGRVPALLNYSAGPEVMREACQVAKAVCVLTSRAFVEKANLQASIQALPCPVFYVEDLRARLTIVDKLWVAAALLMPDRLLPKVASTSTAAILFTSGSEGSPKAVALSHQALLSNVDQILQALSLSPRHVIFNALPIFHCFGLTAGALLPLYVGMCSTLYVSPLHYKEIPKLIGQSKATILFGTSSFLAQYAAHAQPADFKSLELVVAGAERLTDEVRQTWLARFGLEIYEGYGCTETAPVLAVNLPGANRPGSVGRLLPGIEARLVEAQDMSGQCSLHVRGPNLMTGYLDDLAVARMPATALGTDWYDTGDIIRIDDDGFVFIEGRAKRFAKVAGESVSLAWTERIAGRAYPNALHAAARAPDMQRGERIVLFTTQPDAHREDLVAAAHAEGLPEIALPRQIQVLSELPLLGTGKVDHQALQRRAAQLND